MAIKITKADKDLLAWLDNEVRELGEETGNRLSYLRRMNDIYYSPVAVHAKKDDDLRDLVEINDVKPAVDALTATVAQPFVSAKDTVVFEPQGADDIDAATQATKMVNYFIHKRNNSYNIFTEWVKCAMLHETSIVKVSFDNSGQFMKRTLRTTDDAQLSAARDLLKRQDFESIKIKPGEYTSEISWRQPKMNINIENIAPEDFIIEAGAVTMEDARFVAQLTDYYISQVQELWPSFKRGNLSPHERITVFEGYIRYDYDKDGIAELRKVVYTGNRSTIFDNFKENEKISRHLPDGTMNYSRYYDKNRTAETQMLENEEAEYNPYCAFTPIPVPHKFYGWAPASYVIPYQIMKTGFIKTALDHEVINNSPRVFVDPLSILDMESVTDVQSGIIPVDSTYFEPGSITPWPSSPGTPIAGSIIPYLDKQSDNILGISKSVDGIQEDLAVSGNSGEKIKQFMAQADLNKELMVRNLAENGMKKMSWLIYKMILENSSSVVVQNLVMEVTGKPLMDADKSEWFNRDSMTATVGLGIKDDDSKSEAAGAILAAQAALGIEDPKMKYKAAVVGLEAKGIEDAATYLGSEEDYVKMVKEQAQAALQAIPPVDPLIQAAAVADIRNKDADTEKKLSETAENYGEIVNRQEDNKRASEALNSLGISGASQVNITGGS